MKERVKLPINKHLLTLIYDKRKCTHCGFDMSQNVSLLGKRLNFPIRIHLLTLLFMTKGKCSHIDLQH